MAAKATAVVRITEQRGRDAREVELPVGSLDALYEACLRAASGAVVQVQIEGPAGVLRLKFASFIHSPR